MAVSLAGRKVGGWAAPKAGGMVLLSVGKTVGQKVVQRVVKLA